MFKLVGMYGVRGIVTIISSRDCSIENEDRILGVGGGQKGKKWLKSKPTSENLFPHKIAMFSDFLDLVGHNRHNNVS